MTPVTTLHARTSLSNSGQYTSDGYKSARGPHKNHLLLTASSGYERSEARSSRIVFGYIGNIDMADDGKGGERIADMTQKLAGVGCDYVDAHWDFKMMKRTNRNQIAVSKFKCNVFFPNIVFYNQHKPSYIDAADAYAFATRIQDAVLGAGLAWNADDWSYRLDKAGKNILVTYAARPLDIEARPNNIANVIAAITDPIPDLEDESDDEDMPDADAVANPNPAAPVPRALPPSASDDSVLEKIHEILGKRRATGQVLNRDVSDLNRMLKTVVDAVDDPRPRTAQRRRIVPVALAGDAPFRLGNPDVRARLERALERAFEPGNEMAVNGILRTVADHLPFDLGNKDAFLQRLRDHPHLLASSGPQTGKCGFLGLGLLGSLLLDRAPILVMGINQTSAMDEVLSKIESHDPAPGERTGILNHLGARDIVILRMYGPHKDTAERFCELVQSGTPVVLATLANHCQLNKIDRALRNRSVDRKRLAMVIDEAHELMELDASVEQRETKKLAIRALKSIAFDSSATGPTVLGSFVAVSATNIQWLVYLGAFRDLRADGDIDVLEGDCERLEARGYVGVQYLRPAIQDAEDGRMRSASDLVRANFYGRDAKNGREKGRFAVTRPTAGDDLSVSEADAAVLADLNRDDWYPELWDFMDRALTENGGGYVLETSCPGRTVDRNCVALVATVKKSWPWVKGFVVHGGGTACEVIRHGDGSWGVGPVRSTLELAMRAAGVTANDAVYVASNCVRGAVSFVQLRTVTHMVTGSMDDLNLTLQQLGRMFHTNPGAVPGAPVDPATGRPHTHLPLPWDEQQKTWYLEVLCNATELNAVRSYKPVFECLLANLEALDFGLPCGPRNIFFPASTAGTNVPAFLRDHRMGQDSKVLRLIRSSCNMVDVATLRAQLGDDVADAIDRYDDDPCTRYLRLKGVERAAVRRQVQDDAADAAAAAAARSTGSDVINDRLYDEDTDNDHPESIVFIERVQDRIATLYPGEHLLRRIEILTGVLRGDEKRRILDMQAAALVSARANIASASTFDVEAWARDLVSAWSVVKWTPYLTVDRTTLPYVRLDDRRIAALIRTIEPGPVDSVTPRITMEFTSEESVMVRRVVDIKHVPILIAMDDQNVRRVRELVQSGGDACAYVDNWLQTQPEFANMVAQGYAIAKSGRHVVTDASSAGTIESHAERYLAAYATQKPVGVFGVKGAWRGKCMVFVADVRTNAGHVLVMAQHRS